MQNDEMPWEKDGGPFTDAANYALLRREIKESGHGGQVTIRAIHDIIPSLPPAMQRWTKAQLAKGDMSVLLLIR